MYINSLMSQTNLRADERKATLKRGASRILNTVTRALEAGNAAITANNYGDTGSARVQVIVAEVV